MADGRADGKGERKGGLKGGREGLLHAPGARMTVVELTPLNYMCILLVQCFFIQEEAVVMLCLGC